MRFSMVYLCVLATRTRISLFFPGQHGVVGTASSLQLASQERLTTLELIGTP